MNTKKDIEIIQNEQLSHKFTLDITKELNAQIDYLCRKFPTREWSGLLFFKKKGSMEKKNLVLTASKMYLMDIGRSSYTEYSMNEEVIGYITDNDLFDYYLGIIHSHNNMEAFLSGTDINTLIENGRDDLHCLSLVVNNAGNRVAALTRKIEYVKTMKGKYSSFGTMVNMKPYDIKGEAIEWFYLNVPSAKSKEIPEMDKRIKELNAKEASQSLRYMDNFGWDIRKRVESPNEQKYRIPTQGNYPQIKPSPTVSWDEDDVYQPTLFDDLPIATKKSFDSDIDKVKFMGVKEKNELLATYAYRLMVNPLYSPNSRNGSSEELLRDFCKNCMDDIYISRFGKNEDGEINENFENYIDYNLDYLVTYELKDENIDIGMSDLYRYIKSLGIDNMYMQIILNSIEYYSV